MSLVLVLGLILVWGAVSQVLAHSFRLPVILLLMAGGVAFGHHGLNWVEPSRFGSGFGVILFIAVMVVVFEGALHLDLRALKQLFRPGLLLITLGGVITAGGAACIARFALDLDWFSAWLYGGIVSVTGPTVIAPVVRRLGVSPSVRGILEAESVLVDVTGVMLVYALLACWPIGQVAPNWWFGLGHFILGIVCGCVMGGLAACLPLALFRLYPESGQRIGHSATLALLLGCAACADALVKGSAITAAACAGLLLNRFAGTWCQSLCVFFQDLVQLALGLVFVLVAAGIELAKLQALGLTGFAVVFVLMAMIRPFAVFVCTACSPLTHRERMFIAWLGPRGIVAAATGVTVSQELAARGVLGAELLAQLVLMTVVLTVTIQAGLASWAVRMLKLEVAPSQADSETGHARNQAQTHVAFPI